MASSVEAFILARDSGQSHLPSSEFRFSDKFLGMEINLTDMTTTLPQEKKKAQVVKQYQYLLRRSSVLIREWTQLNGGLASTAIAVLPAPLQCRVMQR